MQVVYFTSLMKFCILPQVTSSLLASSNCIKSMKIRLDATWFCKFVHMWMISTRDKAKLILQKYFYSIIVVTMKHIQNANNWNIYCFFWGFFMSWCYTYLTKCFIVFLIVLIVLTDVKFKPASIMNVNKTTFWKSIQGVTKKLMELLNAYKCVEIHNFDR